MADSGRGEGIAGETIRRITLDLRRNTLCLVLHDGLASIRVSATALIDIGESGRLLGVELAAEIGADGSPVYLTLFATTDPNVRSVAATVQTDRGASGGLLSVEIPRRGHGYEIAYPSGNQ